MTDTYEGWTNRETWALALHVNNDQGLQADVHDLLRNHAECAAPYASGISVPELFKDWAEGWLTVDGYAELTGETCLPANLSRIAEDIGSLYRVDWVGIGASFLGDVAEIDSYNAAEPESD